METVIVTLEGNRKVTAHLETGYTVPTDQPRDEGGDGTAPTPFDLLLSALATCAGVYVADFCNHRGIPTEEIVLRQTAEYELDAEGRHRLARVDLQIDLPVDFPDKYRSAIVRVAELCAVKKTILSPPVFSVALTGD
jgi:ribosomal protein S12 methylthiotransferase accessory factor